MVSSSAKSTPKPKNRISNGGVKKPDGKKKRFLWVIKIQCLPFGFFEKELLGYFRQFGTVIRVRVARSIKTGNHKGWAYVGFDNKEVAEIAAETMNGYLMFEHRLLVRVMDPATIPKCMLKGPLLVNRPSYKGIAKKTAISRNKTTGKNDKKNKQQQISNINKRLDKLRNLGIDYEFSPTGTPKVAGKEKENDKDVQVITPIPAKTPKKVVIKTPVKTPQVDKLKTVENTPKLSPKTRSQKAIAAGISTPVQKTAFTKAIMKNVAASARPATIEKKSLAGGKRGRKKSL